MIPRVYAAISGVTQAFAVQGIPKSRINLDDDYAYRSIDDVLDRLAPLLAAHKLCVLPRVLERTCEACAGPEDEPLTRVTLRVAYDLVSVEDASSHTVEAYGEALDASDKATAKAMSAAYKQAVLQAFCVPVSGHEDADQRSPRPRQHATPVPIAGWAQWAEDLSSVIASCMSLEAIDRLLASYRAQLKGLAREEAALYAKVGQAIATRRAVLARPPATSDDAERGQTTSEPLAAGHRPSDGLPRPARTRARSEGAERKRGARKVKLAAAPATEPEVAHG